MLATVYLPLGGPTLVYPTSAVAPFPGETNVAVSSKFAVVRHAAFLLLAGVAFVVAPERAFSGDRERSDARRETRDLVKAVNALAPADIPLEAAQATTCAIERLPGSLAALLPLVPHEHRQVIQECARGRVRLKRGLMGFDLVGAIEDPANSPQAIARIRAFFDDRAVDVACGSACSDEPYPISFDWIVVLDSRSGTLYSFVLNCRD